MVAVLVLCALALALPLATLTMVVTGWYVEAERERLDAGLRLTSDQLREHVDRALAELTATARTLATSPSIDAGDLAAFREQARSAVDTDVVTVTLKDLDGRQFINTRLPADAALPALPRPEMAARLVATRRPVVSGLLISGVTGRRIVMVSAPVLRGEAVTRLVSVVVDIEHFDRLIEGLHIAKPFAAAILDGAGGVVALTHGAPVSDARVEASRAGGAETGPRALDHSRAVRSELSDWCVVTSVEKAAFLAPLRHSLTLLAGLGLVLAGLGGVLVLRYAGRITRAAADLVAAADTIGRGGLVTLELSPIREAAAVGSALVATSRRLAAQRAEIEEIQAAHGRELAAAREHHRLLAETVSDVFVLRRRGSHALSYVSPSCQHMFGYSPSEVRDQEIGDRIHPDDAEAVRGVDKALCEGATRVVSLFRTRRRDGAWIWVECATSLIASAAPGTPDVISVMRDVTERQEQAEELRFARDSAELAQAKAENANRAKSDFLAVMSHEIRTPLATIHGITELLAESVPLSAEQSRYVGLVAEATGIMQRTVDDVLDFARVEAGDMRIECAPFALRRCVEGVLALARPAAARQGTTLGIDLAADLPVWVLGDERRLHQVLANLVAALLRTRRGGLVTLSVQPRPGTPDRLAFVLTETGGHAVAAGGSGLGLTIARRLVALMGGQLGAAIGAGEPSSFRLALTLPEAEAPGAGEPLAAVPHARPARLLLVEDHVINQEIARAILERAGYTVDLAGDGAEALAAVQQRSYDLVLMDVQMPGMDGLTATRRIRALRHPSRQVPIVAMTANVMPDQVAAVREAGMNAHVAKPFDAATLCATIAAQLSTVMLVEESGTGAPPAVFERSAYDTLAATLGPERARGTLAGFIALLDRVQGDDATARAEAATVAAGARRLGFLDLAAAQDLLAAADEATARAALGRCRIARDLTRRVLVELLDPRRVEVSPQVALL